MVVELKPNSRAFICFSSKASLVDLTIPVVSIRSYILILIELRTFSFCPYLVALFSGRPITNRNSEAAIYNGANVIRTILKVDDLPQCPLRISPVCRFTDTHCLNQFVTGRLLPRRFCLDASDEFLVVDKAVEEFVPGFGRTASSREHLVEHHRCHHLSVR